MRNDVFRRSVAPFLLAALPLVSAAGSESGAHAQPTGGEGEPLSALVPTASLTIHLEGQQIRVEGLTPGSSVVLFGSKHETEDFHARLTQVVEVLVDSDQDGEVVLGPLDEKIPPFSVWLAADLQSSLIGYATGDPEFDPANLPAPLLASEAPEGPTTLLHFSERDAVEAILVRHGVSVWRLSGRDAGEGEAVGEPDGNLDLQLQQFEHLAGEIDPLEFATTTDLVLAIDPRTLEWVVAEPLAEVQP